jgi:hypothetical protein
MRNSRALVALATVLLPGLMLLPAWRLSGLGAGEDDILYYYPARVLFGQFARAGQWPWFNPWTGLGRPFLADPQTAVFYPTTWLFVLAPPLAAYAGSLWLHYGLAVAGAYRLLRSDRADRCAALFGGIAFAFGGFLLAHRAHFTMQHAAAWLPWLVWAWRRYLLAPTAAKRSQCVLRGVVASGLSAGQCLAGHVQIAAISMVGAAVIVLTEWLGGRRSLPSADWPESEPARPSARLLGTRGLALAAGVVGLFAIQWIPTAAYVAVCTRTQRGYADFVENSWHPLSAIGWVVPMLLGQRTPNFFDQRYWGPSHQVEQFSYPGVVVLLLAATALRPGWRADATRRPWIVLLVFALLAALGDYGPICTLLYWIPGSSLFRVPARAMLLFQLAVAVLAALSVNDLRASLTPARARLRARLDAWTRRPVRLTLLLLAIPLVLVALVALLSTAEVRTAAWHSLRPWSSALWVPLLVTLATVWLLRYAARGWRSPQRVWALPAIAAIDLGIIGWTIDVPAGVTSAEALLAARADQEWQQRVRESGGRLWVVTGRVNDQPGEYVEPIAKAVANASILAGIPALTDYGPLQPREFSHRFGFEPWGESRRAAELLAEPEWMSPLGVEWVLLCDAWWPAPRGLELALTTPDGWRLFRNPRAAPLAWVEGDENAAAVTTVDSPYSIRTRIEPSAGLAERTADAGPPLRARVIVSRLAVPGWRAEIDGRPVPIDPFDGLLLAVEAPPNRSVTIHWSYLAPGLAPGAVVSATALAILAATGLFAARALRQGGRGALASES